ncbi:hypothetical protein NDU88_004367 [Pleurodeles waltl]|uniref:Uncharacterized protein n=1 Tax=Pleurodeles waltl TaxID=8319 RepID=A0AAV7M814_PLEWA|nr:hypothetical protein NDU88_004367 [Pleurodeles waltl]
MGSCGFLLGYVIRNGLENRDCFGRLLKPPPMPPVTLTNALIMRDVVTQQLMDIDISDNAPPSVNRVDYVNERNEPHYSNSRPIYEHVH